MATLHRNPAGEVWVFVKGAPERVLQMCQTQGAGVLTDAPYWHDRVTTAGGAGERVLGIAAMQVGTATERLSFASLDQGLQFLGLVGLIDPPRPEAIAAIAECRAAGIAVKMITGDHAGTAGAIAQQLYLADNPQVMTGAELDGLSDEALREIAESISVFARTSPEHKLRLVCALQANGHVVAMTGDGVNDAPSLKQADVGIAMGHKGTEAAKEAAQVVLMDDNFASIVAAVHEGRTVYDNIRKVIAWTLPTNGGVALGVVMALVLGLTLPMTSVQILWVNMMMAITLGLVLAFEPPEPGIMRRPPRPRAAPLLSRFLIWRIGFVSVLFLAGTFGIFEYAIGTGRGVPVARTMVVNMLVVMEVFYLFNVRYLHMTSFSLRGALGTPPVLVAVGVVVAAQLAFTFVPFMQVLFDTAPLTLPEGVIILGIGVAVMAVLEIEKVLMRRFGFLHAAEA